MMMVDDIEGARPKRKNFQRAIFTDKEKVKNMLAVPAKKQGGYQGDYRSS